MAHFPKDRMEFFSDAVMAIILTVMALNLPINLSDAHIDYSQLFLNIGIYFISFCYVIIIWYQYVSAFRGLDTITHRMVFFNVILLFALSLVPTFTRVMMEDVTFYSVASYGMLYLVINGLMNLLRQLASGIRYQSLTFVQRWYQIILRRQILMVTIGNGLIMILAWWWPHFSLALYVVITCLIFFRSSTEQAQSDRLTDLTQAALGQIQSLPADQQRHFDAVMNRFVDTLTNGLHDRDEYRQLWQSLQRELQEQFQIDLRHLFNQQAD